MLARRTGWGGLPLVPGLVGPRAPRIACVAPKLIRRLMPETGAVRGLSSSSMAFSSIESEFVDRLARRRSAEVVVGEVPERPSVVTDSLRRGSLMAAVARGVGNGAAGGCETELVRKRLVKALVVMEPRRCRAMSFGLAAEFPLSEDIVKKRRTGMSGKSASLYLRISQRSAGRECGLSQSGASAESAQSRRVVCLIDWNRSSWVSRWVRGWRE
jgi:hypothetical protein